MGSTLVSRLWTFALGVILARLLQPSDYGIYAIGFVTLTILQSMNDLGVSIGLIRWEGDPHRAARTATTIAILSSVALFALAVAVAPALARAVGTPESVGILRLMALGVVLDGFSSVPSALINRALQQARRAAADVVSLVVLSAVTLALADQGFGAWSLAWGSLAGNATATVLIYALAPYRARPGFRVDDATALLRFGLPLAGASLLVFCVLNVDYVVASRLLGAEALGFYVLAFNLSSWPSSVLSYPLRQVSVAAFGRLHDRRRRIDSFTRSLGLVAIVAFLAAALLSSLAGSAVRLVYGARWAAAADAVRFLGVLGALRVTLDFSYDFLVADGRSRATLRLQALWLVALVPALVAGASWRGIEGVGLAHAAVAALVVLPAFLRALSASGVPAGAVARQLARPVIGGACTLAAVALVSRAVEGDAARIAMGSALGTMVYALWFPRSLVQEVWQTVRRFSAQPGGSSTRRGGG